MRARNIKPGFFKNEALGECSPEARLLFIGLWLLADRKGRLEFRPRRWKAEVFPYDNIDPEALCEELIRQGLILLYEVEGVQYAWIPRFLAHQKPHQNETDSVIPPHPSDQCAKDLLPRRKVLPAKEQRTPADSLNPDSLNPERGILKEESLEPCAASRPSPSSPVAFTFPTVGKADFELIRQDEVDQWQALFPGVDVPLAINACLAWNAANPSRRKTPAGVRRHIVSWLTREQNSGRGGQAHGNGPALKSVEQQLAELEEYRRTKGVTQ